MPKVQYTDFEGQCGAMVWDRIKDLTGPIAASSDLRNTKGPYAPTTNALLMTFYQTLAFGNKPNPVVTYDNKLERNKFLVGVNPGIIDIGLVSAEQILRIEKSPGDVVELSLGHSIGGCVVYPLNADAVKLYRRSELAPFEFQSPHLVHESEGEGRAEGVFLGGAIYLRTLATLFRGSQVDPDDPFGVLSNYLRRRVCSFLPNLRIKGSGHTLRIETENGRPVPRLFTSFSGKGFGIDLAEKVGFVPDPVFPVDQRSWDDRYVLDLSEFNDGGTSFDRQSQLLRGWAWFIQAVKTKRSSALSKALEDARNGIVNRQRRQQWAKK